MRILYITPHEPSDLSCGAAQRSHHLHEALKTFGEVTVVRTAPLEKSWFKAFVRRALNAVLPGFLLPLTQVELGRYDAVVVRYLRYASYYAAWRFGPLYVDVDDLPEDVGPRWARRILRLWTRRVLARAKVAWLANPDDLRRIRHAGALPLENIPLPPRPGYRFDAPRGNVFLTVAHLGYGPNVRGLARFLREEWPTWRQRLPGLEYRIVGKGLPSRLAHRWAKIPGVRLLGFVADIDAEYETCRAVVCPVYEGGGTNVKVLEAMARRRPVIAPAFARRGLGAAAGTFRDFRRQVAAAFDDRRRVPVVFSADDGYALPRWIAVASLLDARRPGTRYDVIVLVSDFSEGNRAKFRAWFPGIRFVDVDPAAFADLPRGHVSLSSFNRLLLADALPEYDTLIWSDVDVLFTGDLSDALGEGCPDDEDWRGVALEARGETQGLHNHFPENEKPHVFAAGFMVVNARRWRETRACARFADVARRQGSRLTMQDLDILNLACARIGRLPLACCVFESLRCAARPSDANEYRFLKNVYSDAEMEAARRHPLVIHYCGVNPKVWRRAACEIPAEYRAYWDASPLRPGWTARRLAELKCWTRGLRGRRRA